MYRPTTLVTLAACCLLTFAPQAAAQVVNLGGARQKITTASAVRARAAPEAVAAEVTRLKLGSVLSADARSAEQAEVGSRKDYWYRVALPDGRQGWVFGALLADYDPARRDETIQRIVEERLNIENMSNDDTLDLFDFVEGALAAARGAAKGELERARLHALDRVVRALGTDDKGRLSDPEFQKAHERAIYHHELAGAWAVKPEAFWELETKHRGTPLGDRIAWDAAQALYPGECEGFEVCIFLRLQQTEGRYLGLYPKGAHAAEALQHLSEAITAAALEETLRKKDGDQYAAEEREAVKKALAELRAAVSKAEGTDRDAIVKQLDRLAAHAAK